jgi:hypothetical protein
MKNSNERLHMTEKQDTAAIIMADKIVVKSRVYEGRVQNRRYNETKRRWVDPEWIDKDDFFDLHGWFDECGYLQ